MPFCDWFISERKTNKFNILFINLKNNIKEQFDIRERERERNL